MIYIRSYEKNIHLRKSDAKKISWTSFNQNKYIQQSTKMLLQYYSTIFGSSFGYGIFKGKTPLFCAPIFLLFFRRHKSSIGCCTTSCNWSWVLYSIGTYGFKLVSKNSLYIQQQSMYRISTVFAKTYNLYIRNTFGMVLCHILQTISCNMYWIIWYNVLCYI